MSANQAEHKFAENVNQIDPSRSMTLYTRLKDVAADGADDAHIKCVVNREDIERVMQAASICQEHGFAEVMLDWNWDTDISLGSDLKRLEVAPGQRIDQTHIQFSSFFDGTDQLQLSNEIPLALLVEQILQAQAAGTHELYVDAEHGPEEFEELLTAAQQSFDGIPISDERVTNSNRL